MEGMGKPPGIHLTDYTSSHTIIGLAIISFNGCCAQEGSAMKPIAFAVVVLACCLAWAGCMSGRYTQYPGERAPGPDSLALMTKQDVISMSKAGAGDDVIIDMIKKSGSAFQMRARDVVELADSGVSNRVLRTMIKTTDQESSGEEAGGYYAYPPYWYAGYPFYSPWYFGYSLGYYSPFYYGRGFFAPRYGSLGRRGFYGGHGSYGGSGFSGGGRSGGMRSGGRHR